MKHFSLKIACIFIIIMYCLAPLSALDLNQDDNNKYINQNTDSCDIPVKDTDIAKDTGDQSASSSDDIKDIDDAAGDDVKDINDNSADIKDNDIKKASADDDKDLKTFNRISPKLSIHVDDVTVNDKAVIEISAVESFSGFVTVYVKGLPTHTVFVKNGHAKITADHKLPAGDYSAKVSFIGDLKYKADEASTTFKVNKLQPNFNIHVDDIEVGQKAVVEITADSSFSDYVNVYLNGDKNLLRFYVKNGHATYTVKKDLAAGKYTAEVYYIGNEKFNREEKSTEFAVWANVDPNLGIKVDDIREGQKAVAHISANETLNGDARVYLSHSNAVYPVSIVDGSATVTIDEDLAPGDYEAIVTYNGDYTFKAGESSTTFKVNEKIDPNLGIKVDDIREGQKAVAHITANETLNGEAKVFLDNSNAVYPVSIVNGAGSVAIDEDLAPGEYNAIVSFNGDDTFKAGESSTTFKVNEKADPKLAVTAKNICYGNKAVVSISTDTKFSGNVGVDIGAKHYNVKVTNGKGSLSVSGLAVGKYTAKASLNETADFKASSKSATFSVKKASLVLSAKAKSFKYSQKTKKYTATLKDKQGKALKGKKLTLKVNGKTYAAKTNAKGVATFKITKLNKVGTKNAVISYAGDKSYNKVSKKSKVTVKFSAIGKGSKNRLLVKEIQRALKKNHFYISFNGHRLLIDGWYYIFTKMAVKQFQSAKGLKITGKVDEKTARKLKII